MTPPKRKKRREPRTFLEDHALRSLKAEPTWTVTMYAAYNDLTDETVEELRHFLEPHLSQAQWR